jgi:hypothetical protein
MGRCAKLAREHAVKEWRVEPEEQRNPGVMSGHILLGVLQEPTGAGGLILRMMGLIFNWRLATRGSRCFMDGGVMMLMTQLLIGMTYHTHVRRITSFHDPKKNRISPQVPLFRHQ